MYITPLPPTRPGRMPKCWANTLIFFAGIKQDSKQDLRYINLPPHRQEEVEKLLAEGGSRNWRQLATRLGYEQERVDMFGRGEDPIHTLLTDWAQQDSATLEQLSTALSNIERHDVAKALQSSPDQGITMVWIQFIGLKDEQQWTLMRKRAQHSFLHYRERLYTPKREEKNCILLVLYWFKCLFAHFCSAFHQERTLCSSSFQDCFSIYVKRTDFLFGVLTSQNKT